MIREDDKVAWALLCDLNPTDPMSYRQLADGVFVPRDGHREAWPRELAATCLALLRLKNNGYAHDDAGWWTVTDKGRTACRAYVEKHGLPSLPVPVPGFRADVHAP